jgi:hypothetical protein
MKKITSLLAIGALSIGIQSASANLLFDGDFRVIGAYGGSNSFTYTPSTSVYTGTPVSGWQTTHTNNTMEIWGATRNPPAGQSYLAEMNAFEVSSLYQVITAPNSSPFDIFFQHKGRGGFDTAGFSLIDLGTATSWTRGSGTVLYQTVFTSDWFWNAYSADNIATPVSGRNYAVVFDSISSGAGIPTEGNLLADVRFGDGVFDSSAWNQLTPQSFTPSYGPAGGGGGGTAAVPEPGQVAASLLLLAGIGGYVFIKRRKAAKPAVAPIAA